MKVITRNTFLTRVLDALVPDAKRTHSSRSANQMQQTTHARTQRKDFSCYMVIMDADTKTVVGHLADISSGGFKLDTQKPVPVNRDFRFLMNLPSEVASKPFMVFGARSRWCQVDPLDPCAFNVGYQLTDIFADDLDIINYMIEKYGKAYEKKTVDLRRSYKW